MFLALSFTAEEQFPCVLMFLHLQLRVIRASFQNNDKTVHRVNLQPLINMVLIAIADYQIPEEYRAQSEGLFF